MGSGISSGTLLGLPLLTPGSPLGIRRHLTEVFTPGCNSTMTSRNISQCLGYEHRSRSPLVRLLEYVG